MRSRWHQLLSQLLLNLAFVPTLTGQPQNNEQERMSSPLPLLHRVLQKLCGLK